MMQKILQKRWGWQKATTILFCKMLAYDTTGKEHKRETDHSVASVMHEGLVTLLTTKGEDLFNFGFSELAYRYTTGRMFDEILDEVDKQKEIKYRDNVIEVDFSKQRW